jgi:hypothetical protein
LILFNTVSVSQHGYRCRLLSEYHICGQSPYNLSNTKRCGNPYCDIPVTLPHRMNSCFKQRSGMNEMSCGRQWIFKSYRRYIEGIVGQRRLFSSMGMAELGLDYFFETEQALLLIKMLMKDRELLKALFREVSFCPILFAYDERSIA